MINEHAEVLKAIEVAREKAEALLKKGEKLERINQRLKQAGAEVQSRIDYYTSAAKERVAEPLSRKAKLLAKTKAELLEVVSQITAAGRNILLPTNPNKEELADAILAVVEADEKPESLS